MNKNIRALSTRNTCLYEAFCLVACTYQMIMDTMYVSNKSIGLFCVFNEEFLTQTQIIATVK